jgi:hypothetical protein
MINDCYITYQNDGTPRSVTNDGTAYPPDRLRLLLWRGVHLPSLLCLALLFGIVIGGALTLAFIG